MPLASSSSFPFQEELDSTDTSVVISSCSLAEARLLLDNFLKASIDKVLLLSAALSARGGFSHLWDVQRGSRSACLRMA